MSKHYLLKITVLVLFMFNCIAASFAQDTVKKAYPPKPALVKPATAVKSPYAPAVKPAYAPRYGYQQPSAADSALIKDKTLNGQYQYLLTKLFRYQTPLVAALWKNVRDTLTTERRQLNQAKAQLAEQGQTITGLKTDVTSKDQILNVSNTKMVSISLLGIQMTKASYNLVMWGLVIVFGVIAAIVIARSGAHSREARYRIKLYEELDEEYKAYKSKANEKEKKLARELQTERNKLDELLGRS